MSEIVDISPLFESLIVVENSTVEKIKMPAQKCLICLEEILEDSTGPMSFPCGHNICIDCAILKYKLEITDVGAILGCPTCRLPDLTGNQQSDKDFLAKLKKFLAENLTKDDVEKLNKTIEEKKMIMDPNFKRCPKVRILFE